MNKNKRKIELLAPAKNKECGMAAIDHGADAVYIGASEFGARQAAGNDVADIAELVDYAHKFGAKVYVTFNTILYDNELSNAKNLLRKIISAGVDAILVQDMAVVEMMQEISQEENFKDITLPELHASTQTDNRNAEKVEWLKNAGFNRVVLARELSLKEISEIHNKVPDVELEVFVHGALCVSYSGACYASHHCFNRSANRGECAQFCRLAFDLKDSNGNTIKKSSHLLSLKDMKQIDRIEDIIMAGACSLKIEGRLKDVAYVKNVVAAYSEKLNAVIAKHPDELCRSSYGTVEYSFTPDMNKTFNRGFTNYFLDGRRDDISSFDTPKAMGEYVGYVKEIRHNSFNVAGTATFANGDGLCFFNQNKQLEGFRVNRAENNRLYPLTMPQNLKQGTTLYRNNDIEFERMMAAKTAERKIGVKFALGISKGRVYIKATDEAGRNATRMLDEPIQEAKKTQRENIMRQLEKLGNTPFKLTGIDLRDDIANVFIPSSKLSSLRREVLDDIGRKAFCTKPHMPKVETTTKACTSQEADKINAANVSNHVAAKFYEDNGVRHAATAFELTDGGTTNKHIYGTPRHDTPLMTCRYCLRYAMGFCVKRGGKHPTWKEPLLLVSADGKQFRLVFNCAKCQMEVFGVD